jgi:alkylhydroperoxidase family enzyme
VTWIDTPDDREWQGDLAEYRPRVIDREHDRVDNILAVHGLDINSLMAHQTLYSQAMKGTKTLRKVDREMIALVVSIANDCHY